MSIVASTTVTTVFVEEGSNVTYETRNESGTLVSELLQCLEGDDIVAWYRIEYDNNGNMVYTSTWTGFEQWWTRDETGKVIHYRNSDGTERRW